MNILYSECGSGCDSGWTLYFEQSFVSTNPSHDRANECVNGKRSKYDDDDDEEEEDLSMVSDASSGPPHIHEDDDCFKNGHGCYYPASMDATLVKNSGKRQKFKAKNQLREARDKHSLLDDTASSSPAFNFSKTNYNHTKNNQASMESILDFSQGFSATHYEGGSAFQNHFEILNSPLSGNQLQ